MLNVNDVNQIYLGCQGENLARTIVIDVKPWLVAYPSGNIAIWHKRNGASEATATGATFDPEAGTVTWKPTSTDTYAYGEGEAEIRLSEGSVVKKSRTVKTDVAKAVTGSGVALGSGWQDYLDAIQRAAGVSIIKNGMIKLAINSSGHLIFSYTDEVPVVPDEDATESTYGDLTFTDLDLGPADAYAIAVAGGYTGTKTQFETDMGNSATNATTATNKAAAANADALKSEGFAVGKQNGTDVASGSDYYHNNAKYYRDSAAAIAAGDVIDDDAGAGDTSLTWSADKLSALKSAFKPVETAVTKKVAKSVEVLGTGYLTTDGVYASSSNWKITVLSVTPGQTFDITAYFNAINASQVAKAMYSILDTAATSSNYQSITSSHVLKVGGIHGNTYGAISDGDQTETNIVIPAGAVCMLVSCTNSNTTIKPTVKQVFYISSMDMETNINKNGTSIEQIIDGISITWNEGALTTAGTVVTYEGYYASDLMPLSEIIKRTVFKNLRQRISYTIVPICFYDSAGTLIGYYTDSDADNNAAITVDIADILDDYPNSAYIRIGKSTDDTVTTDAPTIAQLDERISALENVFPPYNITAYPKIICCGDSVTYGFVVEGTQDNPSQIYTGMPTQSYPSCIGRIYGNIIDTVAQSGISIKQFYENKYPSITFSSYNIAIFELGLNPGDEGYLNISDINTPGKSAYIYRQMIAAVRSSAPNLTIALVRSPSHSNNWPDVLNFIAEESDCIVIDLKNTKYINLNDTKYHGWFNNNGTATYDDTHYTRVGYAAKAYDIVCWLGELLPH